MMFTRRGFLASGVMAGLVAAAPRAQAAAGFADYTPGMVDQLLGQGKTVFIDYAADWCSTCARQERVIGALLQQNPAYSANVAFVRVDWDDFGRAPISTKHRIPRRSTLLVLKGDQELGRIVAGTGKGEIKALMDTALAAATTS